jgi:RecA-family ATPase
VFFDREDIYEVAMTDLQIMVKNAGLDEYEQTLLRQNLRYSVDSLHSQRLNLANPEHLAIIWKKLEEFQPDLVVIDTLSASFIFPLGASHNDSGAVEAMIIQPLRELAYKLKCAILLTHHVAKGTGKAANGTKAQRAARSRGSSALEGAVRSQYDLIVLQEPTKEQPDLPILVRFGAPKIKGFEFHDMTLKLDRKKRWLEETNEVPVKKRQVGEPTPYEQFLAYLKEAGSLTRADAIEFAESLGKTSKTADNWISRGVERDKLLKKTTEGKTVLIQYQADSGK